MNLILTSFIFFPEKGFWMTPEDAGLASEDVICATEDGVTLHGWFLQAGEPKATLLFFHGNAGNISGRLFKAKGWVERGVSVLLLDYRGYGRSGGKITKESDLFLDAEAALHWLKVKKRIPPDGVILYGESIGSAPAIELATRQKFKGLILEAPFSSLRELAKKHYPWFPAAWLGDFQFANEEKMPRILAPTFILHGTADEICPYGMGQKLFEKAPQPKDFLAIDGGTHNDLLEKGGAAYFDRPYQFLVVK